MPNVINQVFVVESRKSFLYLCIDLCIARTIAHRIVIRNQGRSPRFASRYRTGRRVKIVVIERTKGKRASAQRDCKGIPASLVRRNPRLSVHLGRKGCTGSHPPGGCIRSHRRHAIPILYTTPISRSLRERCLRERIVVLRPREISSRNSKDTVPGWCRLVRLIRSATTAIFKSTGKRNTRHSFGR